MTLQELTRLVMQGEGLLLEFKRRVPAAQRISKEVIAFANTKGGRILLGVDDDKTIVGVRDAEEEEYALRSALAYHCDPPVPHDMERVHITGSRDVIVVTVPESQDKPHFLIDDEKGTQRSAYVRVGEMSVEASREAVRLMRHELEPSDTLFEFGDKEQILMRYLDSYGRITVVQFAKLANISRRRASQTLIKLAQANVLRIHSDARHDYFTPAF
jgi:predicted HTH transcriptional regulator